MESLSFARQLLRRFQELLKAGKLANGFQVRIVVRLARSTPQARACWSNETAWSVNPRVRSLLRDERGDASGGVRCLSIVRVAKKTAIDVLAGAVRLSGCARSTAR